MTTDMVWVSDLTSKRPFLGQDAGFKVGSTLVSTLISAATTQPERTVFVYPNGVPVSAAQFYTLARRVAKGIIAAGVEPRQGVCILGANAVEWFAADWGAVLAGTIPAPSYVTNSTAVVSHILDLCNAGIIFVDDEEALVKLISAKAQCSNASVRYIVTWDPTVDLTKYPDHGAYLLTWNEFLELGDTVSDDELAVRMALARPESCAKLIFTSGTTGNPKAAMISHDNICWTAHSVVRTFQITSEDTMVSYLPASHIASNALDCVGPIVSDITVYLARADALRGSLIHSLREVRPTIFAAVPRVWEKFHESMLQRRHTMSTTTKYLSDWAKRIGASVCLAEDSGQPTPWGASLAYYLVHANVRSALGLNRARLLFNTASPLARTTNEYFRSFRIKIIDVSSSHCSFLAL
jgi:long-subunit acyl-CoA synthetase (AMP-forming)